MPKRLFPNPPDPITRPHVLVWPDRRIYAFPALPGGINRLIVFRAKYRSPIAVISREPYTITRTAAASILRAVLR